MKLNGSVLVTSLILTITVISYAWFEHGFCFAMSLLPAVLGILWKVIKGDYFDVFCTSNFVLLFGSTMLAIASALNSSVITKPGYYDAYQNAVNNLSTVNYNFCKYPHDKLRVLVDKGLDSCIFQPDSDEIQTVISVQQARLGAYSDVIKLSGKFNNESRTDKCAEIYSELNDRCPNEFPVIEFPH